MQQLIELRIAQVKTLHDQCLENGLNPAFAIADFEAGVAEMRATDVPETDINRYVLMHHRLVHELLYAPPRRS